MYGENSKVGDITRICWMIPRIDTLQIYLLKLVKMLKMRTETKLMTTNYGY